MLKNRFVLILMLVATATFAQDKQELSEISDQLERVGMGKVYIIDSIAVEGTNLITPALIINFSGLKVGDKLLLPSSDNLSRAIKQLYAKKIFSEVKIVATKMEDRSISLLIRVKDRPKLSKFTLVGLSKSQEKEITPQLGLGVNKPVTQSVIDNAIATIKGFFKGKGYNLTTVTPVTNYTKNPQTGEVESMGVTFNIVKGKKTHIYEVNFWGNEEVSPYALIKQLDKTRPRTRVTLFPRKDYNPSYGQKTSISFKDYVTYWGFLSPTKTIKFLSPYIRFNFFKSSKFDPKVYDDEKNKLIDYCNELGFRDAHLVRDSVYPITESLLNIDIELSEGNPYYFGNITWVGNYKFSSEALSAMLDIKKGQPYNRTLVNKKLGLIQSDPSGGGVDISSLYMDNGHLFFRVQPVEKRIYNDTIDIEMRIVEGPVATIDQIRIQGNDVTNERVIRRALRILPGDKFDRSALIRSVREIGALGFFNPETIRPEPKPNVENGTVDIIFNVEEKSSDQIEASISYGGYVGITGQLGFTLKNFSLRQLFAKDRPKGFSIPRGDAQTFSFRVQLNGLQYQSYSASFTEPWIGSGYRRTSMSIGANYSNYSPNAYGVLSTTSVLSGSIQTLGMSLNFGTQLRWPDDYFIFKYGVNYTHYTLNNYVLLTGTTSGDGSSFSNGVSDKIAFTLGVGRSSIDNPTFPRSGSNFSLDGMFTPPYSLFDKSLEKGTVAQQTRLTEFFKLSYEAEWYFPLSRAHGADKNKQLVMRVLTRGGYVGRYNKNMTFTPFERFQVGDVGLVTGGGFLGYEVIGHRGFYVYNKSSLETNPQITSTNQFFTIYNKYLFELRYPLTFSNSATIYVTSYLEMANGWYRLEEYNPFQLRKSIGVGVRFFLPIFGLLGFDYAIGIDRLTSQSTSVFEAGKFSFILGFEPK